MTRHECREITMKLVFSSLDNANFDYATTLQDLLQEFISTTNSEVLPADNEFIESLYNSAINNKQDIINQISEKLKGYEWHRVYKVDKCLLLMAVAEMNYLKSAPPKVILNEYIEMAKQYSTDKSPKFINGILANFVGE